MALFKAKVRKVGTSIGILIPKDIAVQENLRIGEEIELSLLKKRRLADIERAFGSAKGAKPFERDRTDRVDRY